jgi:hypothetical protein
MKKNSYFKPMPYNRNSMLLHFFILLSGLFFCNNIFAADKTNRFNGDTTAEKKVDYLEKIYFSGEDKEGLNTQILITLQEFEGKETTLAVTRQYAFLSGIKERAGVAESACDILDMLAVGIYNIDAAEASQQGVRPGSSKAKAKSVDGLASLGKLSSAAGNLNGGASNVAWNSYYLSGGKFSGLTSGASKVAGAAAQVGNIAGAAGQAGQTLKQLSGIAKDLGADKLFGKKDKPCKDVDKKDIAIGEHVIPSANKTATTEKTVALDGTEMQTVISIPGVSNSLLRSVVDTIKTKPGVRSVEKAYNETLSTVTVSHTGTTDSLSDWIEDKLGSKFKLADYSNGKINLVAK